MAGTLAVRVAGGLSAAMVAGVVVLVTAPGASAWDPAVWDRVAACESTNRWNINTGNGYYGGLQFSHSTWLAYGGGAYATDAHLASKAQQIAVARRTLYRQGPGAWPTCSARAGLTKENGGADPAAQPIGSAPSTALPSPTGAPTSTTPRPTTPAPQPTPSPVRPTPTTNPTDPSTIPYRKILAEDGVLGPLTIAEMQKWVGVKATGIWTQQTTQALQVKVGAKVTGVRDKQTTKKVQGVVGAKVDGMWGRQTTTFLQRYLNDR